MKQQQYSDDGDSLQQPLVRTDTDDNDDAPDQPLPLDDDNNYRDLNQLNANEDDAKNNKDLDEQEGASCCENLSTWFGEWVRFGFGICSIGPDCLFNSVQSRLIVALIAATVSFVALEAVVDFLGEVPPEQIVMKFVKAAPPTATFGRPLSPFTIQLTQGPIPLPNRNVTISFIPFEPFPVFATLQSIPGTLPSNPDWYKSQKNRLDYRTRVGTVECGTLLADASEGIMSALQLLPLCAVEPDKTLFNYQAVTDDGGFATFDRVLLSYGSPTAYGMIISASNFVISDVPTTTNGKTENDRLPALPLFTSVRFSAVKNFRFSQVDWKEEQSTVVGEATWLDATAASLKNGTMGDSAGNSSSSSSSSSSVPPLAINCTVMSLDLSSWDQPAEGLLPNTDVWPPRLNPAADFTSTITFYEQRYDSSIPDQVSSRFQINYTLLGASQLYYFGISCPGLFYFPIKKDVENSTQGRRVSSQVVYGTTDDVVITVPSSPTGFFERYTGTNFNPNRPSPMLIDESSNITATFNIAVSPNIVANASSFAPVYCDLFSQIDAESIYHSVVPELKLLRNAKVIIPLSSFQTTNQQQQQQHRTGSMSHTFSFSSSGSVNNQSYELRCSSFGATFTFGNLTFSSVVNASTSKLELFETSTFKECSHLEFVPAVVGQAWPHIVRITLADRNGRPVVGKRIQMSGWVNYSADASSDVNGRIIFKRISFTSLNDVLNTSDSIQTIYFTADATAIGSVKVKLFPPEKESLEYGTRPQITAVADVDVDNFSTISANFGLPLNRVRITPTKVAPVGARESLHRVRIFVSVSRPAVLVCKDETDTAGSDYQGLVIDCPQYFYALHPKRVTSRENSFENTVTTYDSIYLHDVVHPLTGKKFSYTIGSHSHYNRVFLQVYAQAEGATENSTITVIVKNVPVYGAISHVREIEKDPNPDTISDTSLDRYFSAGTLYNFTMAPNIYGRDDVRDAEIKQYLKSHTIQTLFFPRTLTTQGLYPSTTPDSLPLMDIYFIGEDARVDCATEPCEGPNWIVMYVYMYGSPTLTIDSSPYSFIFSLDSTSGLYDSQSSVSSSSSSLSSSSSPFRPFAMYLQGIECATVQTFDTSLIFHVDDSSDTLTTAHFNSGEDPWWFQYVYGAEVPIIVDGVRARSTKIGVESGVYKEDIDGNPVLLINDTEIDFAVAINVAGSNPRNAAGGVSYNSGTVTQRWPAGQSKVSVGDILSEGTIINSNPNSNGIPKVSVDKQTSTIQIDNLFILDGENWCSEESGNDAVFVWFSLVSKWTDGTFCRAESASGGFDVLMQRDDDQPPHLVSSDQAVVFRFNCSSEVYSFLDASLAVPHVVPQVPQQISVVADAPIFAQISVDQLPLDVKYSAAELATIKSEVFTTNRNSHLVSPEKANFTFFGKSQTDSGSLVKVPLVDQLGNLFGDTKRFSVASASSGQGKLEIVSPGARRVQTLTINNVPSTLSIVQTSSLTSVFVGDPIHVSVLAQVDGVPTPNIAVSASVTRVGDTTNDDGRSSSSSSSSQTTTTSEEENPTMMGDDGTASFVQTSLCTLPGSACGLLNGQTISVTDDDGLAVFNFRIDAGTIGRFRISFSASQSGSAIFLAVARRGRDELHRLRGPVRGESSFERTFDFLYSGLRSDHVTTLALLPVLDDLFVSTQSSSFPVRNVARRISWFTNSKLAAPQQLSTTIENEGAFPDFAVRVTDCCNVAASGVTVKIIVLSKPSADSVAASTERTACVNCLKLKNDFAVTNDDGVAVFEQFGIEMGSQEGGYTLVFDAQGTISNMKTNCELHRKNPNIFCSSDDNNNSSSSSSSNNNNNEEETTTSSEGAAFDVEVLSTDIRRELEERIRVLAFSSVGASIPILISNIPGRHFMWMVGCMLLTGGAFAYLLYNELQNVDSQRWTLTVFRFSTITCIGALVAEFLRSLIRRFAKARKESGSGGANNQLSGSTVRKRTGRVVKYVQWLISWRPRNDRKPTRQDEMYARNDEIVTSFSFAAQKFWNKKIMRSLKKTGILSIFTFDVQRVQVSRLDEIGDWQNNTPSIPLPETPPKIDPTFVPTKFVIAMAVTVVTYTVGTVFAYTVVDLAENAIDRAILNLPAPHSNNIVHQQQHTSSSSSSSSPVDSVESADSVSQIVVDLVRVIAEQHVQLSFLQKWVVALDYFNVFSFIEVLSQAVRSMRAVTFWAHIAAHAGCAIAFVCNAYFLYRSVMKMKVDARRGKMHHAIRKSALAQADKAIGSIVLAFVFQHLFLFFFIYATGLLGSFQLVRTFLWQVSRPLLIALGVAIGEAVLVKTFIGEKLFVQKLTVLRPFAYSCYALYTNVWGVIGAFLFSIVRFLLAIGYPFFFFARIDVGIIPQPWSHVDLSRATIIGLIAGETNYNHPVYLTFAAELIVIAQLYGNKRNCEVADHFNADTSHDLPSPRVFDGSSSSGAAGVKTPPNNSNNNNINKLSLSSNSFIVGSFAQGSFVQGSFSQVDPTASTKMNLARYASRSVAGGLVKLGTIDMNVVVPPMKELFQLRLRAISSDRVPSRKNNDGELVIDLDGRTDITDPNVLGPSHDLLCESSEQVLFPYNDAFAKTLGQCRHKHHPTHCILERINPGGKNNAKVSRVIKTSLETEHRRLNTKAVSEESEYRGWHEELHRVFHSPTSEIIVLPQHDRKIRAQLVADGRIGAMLKADRRSASSSTALSFLIDLQERENKWELDNEQHVGGPIFRRVMRKWHLAVMLILNPSLRQFRKHRLPLPGFPQGLEALRRIDEQFKLHHCSNEAGQPLDVIANGGDNNKKREFKHFLAPFPVEANWRRLLLDKEGNHEERLHKEDEIYASTHPDLVDALLESPFVDTLAKRDHKMTFWEIICLTKLRLNAALRVHLCHRVSLSPAELKEKKAEEASCKQYQAESEANQMMMVEMESNNNDDDADYYYQRQEDVGVSDAAALGRSTATRKMSSIPTRTRNSSKPNDKLNHLQEEEHQLDEPMT